MRNKHGILALALVLALLGGNALLLPKLLAIAQTLPDGEVVTQQTATSAERVPLPEPPEGFGKPYELRFSRGLSAEEQQLWDNLESQMKTDEELRYASPLAEIAYTERARNLLLEHLIKDTRPEYHEQYRQRYKLGDGAPGTILIDLGNITVCIGDEPLTSDTAAPLMRQVMAREEHDSYAEQEYSMVYFGFDWLNPEKRTHYSMTRNLCDDESLRWMRLGTEYMLSGLRPTTPLATSPTQEDDLWFDNATGTVHLPMRYELTDEEMLHLMVLADTLTRQALLQKTPDMLTQQQAVDIAKQWATKLWGMDVEALATFAELLDEAWITGANGHPVWRIQFGPADMLIRQSLYDYEYTGCELYIDAVNGTLNSASCTRDRTAAPPDKTVIQVVAELKQKAIETVQTLFADGKKPKKAVISGYSYYDNKDEYNTEADMMYLISYVVSMPGGVEHQLDFTTGDSALVSYRYWPDGCKDMG